MRWDIVQTSFEDELEKISEISLMGLQPSTVLGAKHSEPLETMGTKKAKEALTRSSETMAPKLAYVREAKETNKKIVAPALQGAATGILLSSLLPAKGKTSVQILRNTQTRKALAAAIGATINVLSKQSAASPAMALRASQKVGKFGNKLKSGPKVSTQIRGTLIGRKGSLPGV
jgi:hypothetical protein